MARTLTEYVMFAPLVPEPEAIELVIDAQRGLELGLAPGQPIGFRYNPAEDATWRWRYYAGLVSRADRGGWEVHTQRLPGLRYGMIRDAGVIQAGYNVALMRLDVDVGAARADLAERLLPNGVILTGDLISEPWDWRIKPVDLELPYVLVGGLLPLVGA